MGRISTVKSEGSSKLTKILKQLDKVSEMLRQTRQSLASEIEATRSQKHKPRSQQAIAFPPDTDLREDYEKLLRVYAKDGPQRVQEFVRQHTVSHLQMFFRANNLPIDVKKHRKEEMARLLAGHLAQSLSIRGDTTPEPGVGQS
jgi:hypothetical protein